MLTEEEALWDVVGKIWDMHESFGKLVAAGDQRPQGSTEHVLRLFVTLPRSSLGLTGPCEANS